jgi:hypothetical protein
MQNGDRVSRTSWHDGTTYPTVLYVVDGVVKLDSGELVGVLGWVPSAEESAATDWVVVGA